MNDPFRTLGVEPGASEADIKKAYKKMAMEHHPDRHPNDKQAEERFKEISVAYETLKITTGNKNLGDLILMVIFLMDFHQLI
jgi:DnaJ-class molecular chaperone